MAKTQIETKKFVDTVEKGVTYVSQKATQPGEKMMIYVPKLMVNIKKDGPGTRKIVTSGNMLFANAPECKPNAPSVIEAQNYISPKMENGTSWNGVVEDINKDPIPQGTSVHVTFASGNIEDVTFSPN